MDGSSSLYMWKVSNYVVTLHSILRPLYFVILCIYVIYLCPYKFLSQEDQPTLAISILRVLGWLIKMGNSSYS